VHIDKKLMHRIFLLIAGAIVFAWLVLDTARATILFDRVWELISPFAAGAAIAFIFNVPMRAIENQLDGVHKLSLRRGLSIVLTILCLILLIMFVFELLIPQIRMTLASLSEKIPAFIDRTATNEVLQEKYFVCKKEYLAADRESDEDAQKRTDLIIALDNSHSFAKTHSLISQLQHCKTWTDSDMETLFEIAMNNSQVRYILTDPDVRAFYEKLLEGQQQLSVDGQAVQAILQAEI